MVLPATPEDLGDPVRTWASARDAVLAALDAPGVLDVAGEYWFGPISIDELIGIVQWDTLTHAWDVGQATGVPVTLDDQLAQLSLDRISTIREGLASMGLVADEVNIAVGASVTARYLALVGREPTSNSSCYATRTQCCDARSHDPCSPTTTGPHSARSLQHSPAGSGTAGSSLPETEAWLATSFTPIGAAKSAPPTPTRARPVDPNRIRNHHDPSDGARRRTNPCRLDARQTLVPGTVSHGC